MSQRLNRMVRVHTVVPKSVFSDYPSVLEQDRKNMTPRAPTTRTGAEPASGFGPLRSLLQAISAVYANREVSPRLPPRIPLRLTTL